MVFLGSRGNCSYSVLYSRLEKEWKVHLERIHQVYQFHRSDLPEPPKLPR